MAQLVWRWSCQRWQTAGGDSNPCWSTREFQEATVADKKKTSSPGPQQLRLESWTKEAHFCVPPFSYVLRTKKGSLLCHTVLLQFPSLAALEACLEACPDVFCSVFMVVTLERKTCIKASNFVSSYIFLLVCCKFHNLEASRLALRPPLAPAAA